MFETDALEISAVRALETQDAERRLWSDAERSWASRSAAEAVGEQAAADVFLARRARLVVERLGERYPALPSTLRGTGWQAWYGWVPVIVAFLLGLALDRLSGGQRLDLLALPVLGLLAWNLSVYLFLLIKGAVGIGKPKTASPVRHFVLRAPAWLIGRGWFRLRAGERSLTAAVGKFAADWAALSAPLLSARAARVMHLAALALALGVLAGLYGRGLAVEYRATWESTFLNADQVRVVLSILLAPGVWLTGLPVPDAAHLASIQSPAGENAASWLHRIAASVLCLVVLPRLFLALRAGWLESRLAGRFPLSLEDGYFRHLLREFQSGTVHVRVLPFSYTLSESAQSGLRSIVAAVFGGDAAVTLDAPVRWEDETPGASVAAQDTLIALFTLSATPEAEVHGAFIDALKARAAPGQALVALIDESAFLAKWAGDAVRAAPRRQAWNDLLTAGRRIPVVFVNLGAPDLALAEAGLDAALSKS
jgi:hypothetical protein